MTTPCTVERIRTFVSTHVPQAITFSICFYITFFPLGITFREIGAIVSLVLLCVYYLLDYQNSVLRRLPIRGVMLLFWAVLTGKTFHTVSPSMSWYAYWHIIYSGPVLLLAGIEGVRSRSHLLAIALSFCVMGLYTGLDGVYQFSTGFDLLNHEPYWGWRLTAMWPTGRIGNLIAVTIPACLALAVFLPGSMSRTIKTTLLAALLLPMLFLWAWAKSRSGWLGLGVGMAALALMTRGRRAAIVSLVAGLVFAGFASLAFAPQLNLGVLLNAPRFQIWDVGVQVWKEYFWFGAGVNAFEPAYKMMGLGFDPTVFAEVPHPHNIYIQFLAETGIVGFFVAMLLFGGVQVYCIPRLRRCRAARTCDYWVAAACLWSAHLAWLVAAFSAHNFYRPWWLGIGMLIMGLTLSAVYRFCGQESERPATSGSDNGAARHTA